MRIALLVGLLGLSFVSPATSENAEFGKLTRLPGATLYVEVRGGGTALPLIVVNGGPGLDHTYLHCSSAWDQLATRRAVVFYDQRGVGRSPALRTAQSCTVADQIADLDALATRLGYPRFDLLGHSWGGYLVMAYAARHPERIAHLVICDSAAPKWEDTVFLFKDVFPETVERQAAWAFAEELGDTSAIQADFREYQTMLFYSPEKRDAFVARPSKLVINTDVNRRINVDAKRFDLNPELPKYRFPTLVVTGRYDMNVAPAVAWKIHRAIPGSRFEAFERSGHMPFYEEPEKFVRLVEEFLAGR